MIVELAPPFSSLILEGESSRANLHHSAIYSIDWISQI